MTIDELAREYEAQYNVLSAKMDAIKPLLCVYIFVVKPRRGVGIQAGNSFPAVGGNNKLEPRRGDRCLCPAAPPGLDMGWGAGAQGL